MEGFMGGGKAVSAKQHNCRRHDGRAFAGVRRHFVLTCFWAIGSWAIFALLLYGLWESFVWLNERVSHWAS